MQKDSNDLKSSLLGQDQEETKGQGSQVDGGEPTIS